MSMKRGYIFLIIFLVLTISFVSAGFFSNFFEKLTGNAVSTGDVYPNFCPNWQAANCASGKCGYFNFSGGVINQTRCIGDSSNFNPCSNEIGGLGRGCCYWDQNWWVYKGFSGDLNGITKVCCDGTLLEGITCQETKTQETDAQKYYSASIDNTIENTQTESNPQNPYSASTDENICEGDFDCDGNVDGTDVATFKADFGRNLFNKLCTNSNQCKGDFDCDGDVDGTDVATFKADFGRNKFNKPCQSCFSSCIYPELALTIQTQKESYEIGENVLITGLNPSEDFSSTNLPEVSDSFSHNSNDLIPNLYEEEKSQVSFSSRGNTEPPKTFVDNEIIIKFKKNPHLKKSGFFSSNILGNSDISSDINSINSLNKKFNVKGYEKILDKVKEKSFIKKV